jgi:hypothetical protein
VRSVSVDLDRLVAQARTVSVPEADIPSPPVPMGGGTIESEGFDHRTLEDPSDASQGRIAERIERQQRQARVELERRLRAIYLDELRQFELDTRRELDSARPTAYDEANRRIRVRFERYADARAPLVADLYNIVGFPDPNPRSEPPKQPLGMVSQQLFDEAVRLRGEIAEVERSYQADKREILAQTEAEISASEATALARLAERAEELELRAGREAQEQVRISVEDLGLQLADPQRITLPKTPDRRVVIEAEPPFENPPQVPSRGIPNSAVDVRRRLERELEIWLRVNRLRLDPKARDATAEFSRWRTKYRAGL